MKKNNPLSVQKRLSLLSSNKEIFNSARPKYQEALDKAGYKHKLVYDPTAKSDLLARDIGANSKSGSIPLSPKM